MKLHSAHIEVAVAVLIGYRNHVIVPNVSWGLGLRHECDLLVLDQSKRFTEVEIKISRADLKKDLDKWHGHKSELISRLVYAMPAELIESARQILPASVGLISCTYNDRAKRFVAKWERVNKHDKKKQPVPEQAVQKFLELGCMRIWTLKQKLNRAAHDSAHKPK
jgi:hypothetical protein